MKNLLLPIALFFTSILFAQNPNWRVFHGPLRVNDIADDGDNLWIATAQLGVVSMDKATGEWENYSSLNAPFTDNLVLEIEVDGQGRIWAPMWDYDLPSGIMVYNQGVWQTILQLPDGSTIKKPGISKDCEGNIWIQCNGGRVFSIENQVWTERTTDFNGQIPLSYCLSGSNIERCWVDTFLKRSDINGQVSYILPDSIHNWSTYDFTNIKPVARFSNGKILVRVADSKEIDFDVTTTVVRYFTFDGLHWKLVSGPLVEDNPAPRLIPGQDGILYIQDFHKVFSFDGDAFSEINLPGFDGLYFNVKSVDANGDFWVANDFFDMAAEEKRLWKFNQSGGISYPNFATAPVPLGYVPGKVRANHKGEIWYYSRETLTKLDANGWTNFQANQMGSPPLFGLNQIKDIVMDWDGNPWVSFDVNDADFNEYKPVRWDGNQWQFCDHSYRSIAFEPNTSVYWYTDKDYQLHRKNGASDAIINYQNQPLLPQAGLKALVFDEQGDLWAVGTVFNSGLFKRTPDGVWTKYDDSNSPVLVDLFPTIAVGANDEFWLTNSDHTWRLKDDVWARWDTLSTWGNRCFSIAPGLGASWASSTGLLKIAGNSVEQRDILDAKMPYNGVSDIAVDTLGNVWMASYYGLAVYNENGLNIDSYLTPVHEPSAKPLSNFLWPNPFEETTQVDLTKLGFAAQQLSVFNAQGALVQSQNIQNQEVVEINRNGAPSGLYFVVIAGEGKSVVGKLVAR